MELKEFLLREGITQSEIARIVGVSRGYMFSIIKKIYNPSVALAHQISAYTKGKVQVHEIRRCSTSCAPGCACSKGVKK